MSTPGSQPALFASYGYHAFITDREGGILQPEADHRRHAEIENAIRDLKYTMGLNHLPSGRFAAYAAWLAVQELAHNIFRWTCRIGLGEQVVTTKTLRQRFFSLAGRITRSARHLTLHLPHGWPLKDGPGNHSSAVPLRCCAVCRSLSDGDSLSVNSFLIYEPVRGLLSSRRSVRQAFSAAIRDSRSISGTPPTPGKWPTATLSTRHPPGSSPLRLPSSRYTSVTTHFGGFGLRHRRYPAWDR